MNVTPVTWPNGLSLYRVDPPHASKLLEKLTIFSGSQKTRRGLPFPGPNPVSIERADYDKFRAQPYHITEKTDGTRALMMVTDIDDLNVVVIFDRTLTPFLFPIHLMPRVLYQGSLFDGEIVYDKLEKRFTFLCFDAINISGVPVFQMPFTERLSAISMSLTHYAPSPSDPGIIRPKHFLPCVKEVGPAFDAHVKTMSERYDIDGVIFMPELDRVIYGRHDNLMKLKTTHSIDFSVKNGKLFIYDETARRNKVVGTPTGPLQHLAVDGAIVECVLDPASKKYDLWKVLGARQDKTTSNNKFTYEKTLNNIRENLSLSEVLQGIFDVSAHGNPIWN